MSDLPWHVSVGTWEWVRSMYGLAMHLTGAELSRDVHLKVFDEALALRDRELLTVARDAAVLTTIDQLVDLAKNGPVTAAQLRVLGDLVRLEIAQRPPAGSPAGPPPAAAESESV